MRLKTKTISLVLVVCMLIASMSFFVIATPNGVMLTPGTSTGKGSNPAGQDSNAIAGNVTELTVVSNSTTQSWQGYYGNVSGSIGLKDGSDNVLYNWSLGTPEGEIYASNASSITWDGIQCYDEPNNLTFFESMFGISINDADGLNETFNLNNHEGFYTNSIQFTSGECNSTKLFNSLGVGTFDEVLLTDGSSIVFASLLSDDANGFDDVPHDFEMIVLEDGHGTDVSTTMYYFWAELE
jgi:predicted enzyme related to lactoylglutathione lyase